MAKNETVEEIISETMVNATELASILGLTARRVQQLGQDGTLQFAQRGRYSLGDAVQRYISFISRTKENTKQETERLDAEVNIKKAKAIKAVLEAKELQGKMHRSEDVAAMTEDLVFTIRGMLIALPGRLAVDVAAAKSSPEAAEIIRTEVHKVLEELAAYQYDPRKYEDRVRDRLSWDSGEELDVDD